MTEPTHPLTDCFAAHRELFDRATLLSLYVARFTADESDLLRLAASCVAIGARRALQAQDPRDAILAWSECELGERQIRGATYRAYRSGALEQRDYDHAFAVAIKASRARRDEMLRLRRRLRQHSII